MFAEVLMTEESLFEALLAKPPEERQAFLATACAGDDALPLTRSQG